MFRAFLKKILSIFGITRRDVIYDYNPCEILTTDADYSKLPSITGWGGGAPKDGVKVPSNESGGYYVHGLFSCVPDSKE